jgi:excisionase family DNA binding protein
MTPTSATVNAHTVRELPKLLLTVEEAAETLTIGRTTMFALIKDGSVRSVRIGARRLVPFASLESFVAELNTATWGES